MDTHNLIAMANRVGQFCESFSDRAEALAGIGDQRHLKPAGTTADEYLVDIAHGTGTPAARSRVAVRITSR